MNRQKYTTEIVSYCKNKKMGKEEQKVRDVDLDEEKTAARLAIEAAERARRIEIMNKISKLEKEKDKCEECLSGLSGVVRELSGNKEDLGSALYSFLQNDLTREITIPGVFDGMGAWGIRELVNESLEQMNSYAESILLVVDGIKAQISKLQNYIDELNKEINSLKMML